MNNVVNSAIKNEILFTKNVMVISTAYDQSVIMTCGSTTESSSITCLEDFPVFPASFGCGPLLVLKKQMSRS